MAFEGCTGLTSVTIPSSVDCIDGRAFYGCTGLTSINISAGVQSIAYEAFSGCTGLTSVTIPTSVTGIGEEAFYGCTGLISVTIPTSVTTIGTNAFAGVRHIEYHGTATGAPWGANSINGYTEGDFVYADNTKTTLIQYLGNNSTVSIPTSVTAIGNKAFCYNRSLTAVTIPSGVTSIGNYSFYYTNLNTITIPSNVTSIGSSAFHYCNGLTSVTIGSGITSIGQNAFSGCESLTSVNYTGTIAQWCAISFGDDSANPICYSHSFNINGTPVTNLVIPDSVTSIGNCAFQNCNDLNSVIIGSGVTSIGNFAFRQCNSLDTVYMMPTTPPSLGTQAFIRSAGAYPVFILNGCAYNNYYASSSWTAYRNKLRDPIIDISIDVASDNEVWGTAACLQPHTSYVSYVRCDSTAVVQATPNYGYHFDHWSNGNTANPDTLHLTHDSTVTAFFARNSYTVTASVNDASLGEVVFPNGDTALYLDTLMVKAVPVAHYHVASWMGDGIVAISPNKDTAWVAMTADLSISCNFAIDTYTVAVASNDIVRGTVTGGGEFVYGTACTVEATAYTGYTFHSWSNGVTANPYTFVPVANTTLTAIFLAPGEEPHTVTVSVNDPTMGTATANGNASATVISGETVTLTATANEGYRFVRWSDNNTEATRTITVTSDMSFTAYFEAVQGIEDVSGEKEDVRVYVANGRIHVTHDGQAVDGFRVYDMMGRSVRNKALPAGVYLVKVGDYPARKVVVIR